MANNDVYLRKNERSFCNFAQEPRSAPRTVGRASAVKYLREKASSLFAKEYSLRISSVTKSRLSASFVSTLTTLLVED